MTTGAQQNQRNLFEARALEINRWADAFSRAVRERAATAQKEEEIRVAVERQIAQVAADLNVQLVGQHEFTLLHGQVDSVYGSVFIEYKNPSDASAQLGPELSSPGTRKVVERLQRRFADVRRLSEGRNPDLLGIGCDGRFFVFARFVSGRVEVEQPVEVSPWSSRRFLWALFNLGEHGFALTPESLARDFGATSGAALAFEGVGALVEALRAGLQDAKVRTLFQQWSVLFGEVCGYDVSDGSPKLARLRDHYGLPDAAPPDLLFCLQTYYALLMKLLASHVVNSFWKVSGSPLANIRDARSSGDLHNMLTELEQGGIFRHLSVTNFLEGDLFSWYLASWTDKLEKTVRDMAGRLLSYNPVTLRDNPRAARDLLKKLYHELFPRQLRHDLGEYYTPDWLAEMVLDAAGYDGDPRRRLLDPACGSGTFLVLALSRVRRWLEANFETAPPAADVAKLALENVIGFDLNPLAVLAARTNYLIHVLDLFEYYGQIHIPVYLCDSVLTPAEYGETEHARLTDRPVAVPTSAALFLVPREVTRDERHLNEYCDLLARHAAAMSGSSGADFVRACRNRLLPVSAEVEHEHTTLFEAVRALDREGRNGLWARFIKNAFAPVWLTGRPVEMVVGNPPWVNWESLPGRMDAEGQETYRQRIAKVFERYGLFSLGGPEARLGGGKKDLSMLFAYACADHYLRSGGTLAFVITQTLFKTKGAGDGFRRFQFADRRGRRGRPRRVFLAVREVHDLSALNPFEGATNRTAIFVCRKAAKASRYPVPYMVWSRKPGHTVRPDMEPAEARTALARKDQAAKPVSKEQTTSPWLTASPGVLDALGRMVGQADYKAVAGSCTWLNSVFWVRRIQDVPSGVLIENLHNVGKIKVPAVRVAIEPDLLYPLLRGRDVRRWRAVPSARILLTQDPKTRQGIPEQTMRRRWFGTWTYLKEFEELLRGRSGYRKYFSPTDPFYSIYNVGPYTMAKWKVFWPEVGNAIRAGVCGPDAAEAGKPAIPDHTIIMVACDRKAEAYYLCAALNSTPAHALVRGYIVLHPSPHVLEHVRVPRYRRDRALHNKLAELGRNAHEAAAARRGDELAEIEATIDKAAAKLWRISPTEMEAIQAELRGPGDESLSHGDGDDD